MAEQQREAIEAGWKAYCETSTARDMGRSKVEAAIRAALSHAEGEAEPVAYRYRVKGQEWEVFDENPCLDGYGPNEEVQPLYIHPALQVAGWRSGYPEYDGDGGVCHIPLRGHPDFMVVAFNRDGNLVDSCGDDVGYSLEDVERWKPIDTPTALQVAVPEGWRLEPSKYGVIVTSPDGKMTEVQSPADPPIFHDDPVIYQFLKTMLAAAPTAPAGEPAEIPEIESRWRHHNGNIYTVESITNVETERPGQYPVTVVYRGENGKLWSRPAHDWHRSMTFESVPEQPVSDPDGRLTVKRALDAVWEEFEFEFDPVFLEAMEGAGLIEQADGFLLSMKVAFEDALAQAAKSAPDEREIAALREDAERLDSLQRFIDKEGGICIHNGEYRSGENGYLGMGLANTGRTLREGIDMGCRRLRAGKEDEPS